MYFSLRSEVLPQQIPPDSNVLVAVSGGPDSVALAHIIWRYANEDKDRKISLAISHVNHKVRAEADEEAELVRNLARKWNVRFVYHEFDAKKNASECRKSFQEASREWRYSCWQEDMKELGCTLLATAHHLGDQAETILYRLIRGSGTAGLAGIYPVKGTLIRPLLTVSKIEILDYCETQQLPFAIDKSNLEPLYCRNRIRLELIPELEKRYNEKVQEALGRTAEVLRWDEEYISSQVDSLWSKYSTYSEDGSIVLAPEAWKESKALLSRLLRRAAAEASGEFRGLEYKFIKLLMSEGKKTGWRQNLPGLLVEAKRNGFYFFRKELEQEVFLKEDNLEKNAKSMEIRLIFDQWHELSGLGFSVGIFNYLPVSPDVLWVTELDKEELNTVQTALVCRLRKVGDRIYIKGLGHKTIKKIFQEKKIPSTDRGLIPVFALGEFVLWIPGVCRSDSLLPSGSSSPKLYLAVRKRNS